MKDYLTVKVSGLAQPIAYADSFISNGLNVWKNSTEISRALNALIHTDNIMLTDGERKQVYYKKDYDYILSEKELKEFKLAPLSHQMDAVNFGLHPRNKKWLLLDDMGLG